jgi:hypothetical protein
MGSESNDPRAPEVTDRVWVTWEHQRRSKELAAHFGCFFSVIAHKGVLRYPRSIAATLSLLMTRRPRILFVQNPSMVLASIAVLWGILTGAFVVVDRHTTFLLNREYRVTPSLILFKLLNNFTLRYADITVVTNSFLAELVSRKGGTPFILPDKLPEIPAAEGEKGPATPGVRRVLLISSWAEDEPIVEAIRAVSLVRDHQIEMFVSGSLKKAPETILQEAPANVTFTDFLPDRDFLKLLTEVDVVVVLTTADHTMLCGCYEAVAAEKALLTSDKEVLREYFDGAIFVENSTESIGSALDLPDSEIEECRGRMASLKTILSESWAERARTLEAKVPAK